MAFDLYSIQTSIEDYLVAELPQFKFYRGTIPEDQQVDRDENAEVEPFFIAQYGPMTPLTKGRSIKGARNDEYTSWVQYVCVSSVERNAANALSLLVDRLIGFKPEGGTKLIPSGGPTDYGSRQYSVRPVLYYQSQQFDFNIAQNGLDGHLTP